MSHSLEPDGFFYVKVLVKAPHENPAKFFSKYLVKAPHENHDPNFTLIFFFPPVLLPPGNVAAKAARGKKCATFY